MKVIRIYKKQVNKKYIDIIEETATNRIYYVTSIFNELPYILDKTLKDKNKELTNLITLLYTDTLGEKNYFDIYIKENSYRVHTYNRYPVIFGQGYKSLKGYIYTI